VFPRLSAIGLADVAAVRRGGDRAQGIGEGERVETEVRESAVERLADAIGIVPKYLDQTGTEWRETAAASRIALLAAMGIDASSDAASERALRALRLEERRELLAPVRVVERTDDTARRHPSLRLASPADPVAH